MFLFHCYFTDRFSLKYFMGKEAKCGGSFRDGRATVMMHSRPEKRERKQNSEFIPMGQRSFSSPELSVAFPGASPLNHTLIP